MVSCGMNVSLQAGYYYYYFFCALVLGPNSLFGVELFSIWITGMLDFYVCTKHWNKCKGRGIIILTFSMSDFQKNQIKNSGR